MSRMMSATCFYLTCNFIFLNRRTCPWNVILQIKLLQIYWMEELFMSTHLRLMNINKFPKKYINWKLHIVTLILTFSLLLSTTWTSDSMPVVKGWPHTSQLSWRSRAMPKMEGNTDSNTCWKSLKSRIIYFKKPILKQKIRPHILTWSIKKIVGCVIKQNKNLYKFWSCLSP